MEDVLRVEGLLWCLIMHREQLLYYLGVLAIFCIPVGVALLYFLGKARTC